MPIQYEEVIRISRPSNNRVISTILKVFDISDHLEYVKLKIQINEPVRKGDNVSAIIVFDLDKHAEKFPKYNYNNLRKINNSPEAFNLKLIDAQLSEDIAKRFDGLLSKFNIHFGYNYFESFMFLVLLLYIAPQVCDRDVPYSYPNFDLLYRPGITEGPIPDNYAFFDFEKMLTIFELNLEYIEHMELYYDCSNRKKPISMLVVKFIDDIYDRVRYQTKSFWPQIATGKIILVIDVRNKSVFLNGRQEHCPERPFKALLYALRCHKRDKGKRMEIYFDRRELCLNIEISEGSKMRDIFRNTVFHDKNSSMMIVKKYDLNGQFQKNAYYLDIDVVNSSIEE